jgi:hypothetical protein
LTLRLVDDDGGDATSQKIAEMFREILELVDGGEVGGALVLLVHDDGFSAYAANVSEQEMVWVMERHKAQLFRE